MHSREVIQKHLKGLQKLNYSPFRWWRNYNVPKTLPKSTHIEKRINNGDFDPSPYFWMTQSALWEKYDNDNAGLEDFERAKRGGLLLSKYERLMKDHYQDDDDKLNNCVPVSSLNVWSAPNTYLLTTLAPLFLRILYVIPLVLQSL